jgi:predicted Rossmann fold flavoprotein
LTYDAIILGAGAAGLFCAALAGQRGRRVLVFEHAERPGKKILISGGGRCNFTNLRTTASNFLSANPHFAKSALARYTPADFVALVEKHRIPYHEKTAGQLFCDGPAQAILTMLQEECRAGGVEMQLSCSVKSVRKTTHFTVETAQESYHSTALVVATGGLSIPKLGATDLGYRLARQFGLKVEPPYPALVPLTFDADHRRQWCDLAGVAADVNARFGGHSFREQMLITHRGLSGPAILQISSYWNRPGGAPGATHDSTAQALRLDLLPGRNFREIVEARRASGDKAAVKTLLAESLPRRLAERWLDLEGFAQPTPPLARLEERLHAWSVIPAGSEGFEKAEVTGGGVSTGDLDSKTMQARNAPGLFFVGEVVDVTGHLGGYNFQWAWASACAAAQAL